MILSGRRIQERLGTDIIINPFNEKQLNPNSYNLRLHNELLVYTNDTLDIKQSQSTERLHIPDEGLVLQPHKLYLGRTVEYTESHKHVPMLEGRSSLGRLGLFVHITAGFGDVGFCGYWTLEIFCVHPIRVYPFIELCQVFYYEVAGEVVPYTSKYQHNKDIQPSFIYKEFENPETE